jgi:hypothetical protein
MSVYVIWEPDRGQSISMLKLTEGPGGNHTPMPRSSRRVGATSWKDWSVDPYQPELTDKPRLFAYRVALELWTGWRVDSPRSPSPTCSYNGVIKHERSLVGVSML